MTTFVTWLLMMFLSSIAVKMERIWARKVMNNDEICYLIVDDVPELHSGEDGEDLGQEGDAEEPGNQGNQTSAIMRSYCDVAILYTGIITCQHHVVTSRANMHGEITAGS